MGDHRFAGEIEPDSHIDDECLANIQALLVSSSEDERPASAGLSWS
jgi:hypothetical protein